MHPALPVIALTTLSTAGLGLLTWLGISIALLSLRGQLLPALEGVHLAGLALGLLLSSIGLLSSMAQATRPQRSWRELTRWRTSWLSREGVLAMLTVWPALMVGGLLLWTPAGPTRAALLACLGLVLALLALATLAAAMMVHASQRQVREWRHPLVVPLALLSALATGLGLQFVVMTALLGGQGPAMMAVTLAVLGALLALLQWVAWYENGRLPADTTGAPAPLPAAAAPAHAASPGIDGDAAAPAAYAAAHAAGPRHVSRTPPFALARRHAATLRVLATLSAVALPALGAAMLLGNRGSPLLALALATGGLVLAAFIARWLFFAEGRLGVALPG